MSGLINSALDLPYSRTISLQTLIDRSVYLIKTDRRVFADVIIHAIIPLREIGGQIKNPAKKDRQRMVNSLFGFGQWIIFIMTRVCLLS